MDSRSRCQTDEPATSNQSRDSVMQRLLNRGDRGPMVARVQQQLNLRLPPKHPKLKVDGCFGPKTEQAVRDFQRMAGFTGRLVDGIVGPKTIVKLFAVYDLKVSGHLRKNAGTTQNTPPGPSNPGQNQPAQGTNPPPSPASTASGSASQDEPPPRRYNASAQLAPAQYSDRDGWGAQVSLSLTARTGPYFSHAAHDAVYNDAHGELQLGVAFGLPNPYQRRTFSGVYTGQLTLTYLPITDWLVLWDRLHLFSPSVQLFGQIPLYDSPSRSSFPSAGSDPSSHSRLGFDGGAGTLSR